jgi:acetylornithine deacetylase/succinyl-diaminopimelate desuccinylase-like protein
MINEFKQPLDKFLTDMLPAMTVFCSRIVQTPSVNGVNAESDVAEMIAAEAGQLGLHVRIVGDNPQRPNVIISTAKTGPVGLLLVGHMDTVPTGNTEQWSHHPFSGQITEGKLYGRGAIDNKGGIAAALYTLAALKATKGALAHGRAQLICVSDEESGATGELGVKYLIREKLLAARGGIYVYPGLDELPLGHRGLTRFKITAHGLAAHTGYSGKTGHQQRAGHNAVTAMAELLLHLEHLDTPRSHLEYFDQYRAVITPGTLITGGTAVNMVPDRCESLIDVRTIPEFDRAEAADVLKKAIRMVEANRPGIHFESELLNYVPAALADSSAPLFAIIERAAEQVVNFWPERTICGPANEGYLFIQQGIPMVCGFGPTGANAHAVDEYVDLDSLRHAALIYALTAVGMDAETVRE